MIFPKLPIIHVHNHALFLLLFGERVACPRRDDAGLPVRPLPRCLSSPTAIRRLPDHMV